MADYSIIPDGIRDQNVEALYDLIDGLGSLDLSPVIIYLIDRVSSEALPHLAEQFHVAGYEGWIQATTDLERRALIRTAIEKHRFKGTPGSIRIALAALSMEPIITEWFNYDPVGDPFHFKVEVITSGREVDAALSDLIEYLIFEYKNVRSVLDSLTFITGVTSPIPIYNMGYIATETVAVYG
jgi:phage tail P2-like protein